MSGQDREQILYRDKIRSDQAASNDDSSKSMAFSNSSQLRNNAIINHDNQNFNSVPVNGDGSRVIEMRDMNSNQTSVRQPGESQDQSQSFVAIDLYGQDRSEYISTSLATGLIQVPVLLCITELLTVRKAVNVFEVAYAIAML